MAKQQKLILEYNGGASFDDFKSHITDTEIAHFTHFH